MDESLMPEWMRRAKESSDLDKARADSAANAHLVAEMKVKTGSQVFWRELKEKLTIQTEFLPTAFGMVGTIHAQPCHDHEELCRVDVRLSGPRLLSAYMNLFYREEGSIIRMHPQFGQGADTDFVWSGDAVLMALGGKYRNAEEVATWIVRKLVRQINPDALKQISAEAIN